MALTDNGNALSAADVAAVMGGNSYGGLGNGDGAFWLIILFLFAFAGNSGWGFGGGTNSEVQRGFDQQAVMNGINGINAASVANTASINQSLNDAAMAFQNCCCENRAGISDLKYTIASEASTSRATFQQGVQDILSNQTANNQAILDKLCQLELEGVKQRNADLLAENSALKFAASQSEQTAAILANNTAQTQALEQYLNPAPIPAYVVQNPNCCQNGFACGV